MILSGCWEQKEGPTESEKSIYYEEYGQSGENDNFEVVGAMK